MRPGDWVKANASTDDSLQLAVCNALSTHGTIFCICARLASSGTTPPYCSCIFCVAIMLDNIFPSRQTDADVSSHEDSMASIVSPSCPLKREPWEALISEIS